MKLPATSKKTHVDNDGYTVVGDDDPGQCAGDGKLRQTDQPEDRRPAGGQTPGARAYNADPDKPHFINTLSVFGSYPDPKVDPLGDIDVELTYGRRITDQKQILDYSRANGRSLSTYIDQLLWPPTELLQHLKKRSGSINFTTEDIARITDPVRDDLQHRGRPESRPAVGGQNPRRPVKPALFGLLPQPIWNADSCHMSIWFV